MPRGYSNAGGKPNYQVKQNVAAIKNGVKKAGQAIAGWAKAGMPLPGAVKPAPGKTFLRGKQVPMMKHPVNTTPPTSYLQAVKQQKKK